MKLQSVNREWGVWEGWSLCSKSCGEGRQTRRRFCTNCDTELVVRDIRACNQGRCPTLRTTARTVFPTETSTPKPFQREWGTWENWSSCSKSCDIGQQRRIKSCMNCNDGSIVREFRDCNLGGCPVQRITTPRSRVETRTKPIARRAGGCFCNGHIHRGKGQCRTKSESGCGNWCYVNNDSTCRDIQPSFYGAPFNWSCDPCSNARTVNQQPRVLQTSAPRNGFDDFFAELFKPCSCFGK